MEFYTVQEIAEMLKVSEMTVIRWIKSNKLKASKLGGQFRIKKQDLEDFVNNK